MVVKPHSFRCSSQRRVFNVRTSARLRDEYDCRNDDSLENEENDGAEHQPEWVGRKATDGVKKCQILVRFIRAFLLQGAMRTRQYI